MLRSILLLACFPLALLAQSSTEGLLVDGRDENGRQRVQQQLNPDEVSKYLKVLFPRAQESSLQCYGSARGSFTGVRHDQILISAFFRDSGFSGSSAQAMGIAVLGIFEAGYLVTRFQSEGDPILLLGARDLDHDGLSELLCVHTWQGAGMGEESLKVWSSKDQRLRAVFNHRLYWYSFMNRKEQASVVVYQGGQINKRGSYRAVQYHREMAISTPVFPATTEKPWREE